MTESVRTPEPRVQGQGIFLLRQDQLRLRNDSSNEFLTSSALVPDTQSNESHTRSDAQGMTFCSTLKAVHHIDVIGPKATCNAQVWRVDGAWLKRKINKKKTQNKKKKNAKSKKKNAKSKKKKKNTESKKRKIKKKKTKNQKKKKSKKWKIKKTQNQQNGK